MSTLTEIEAAVEGLPLSEQEALLAFLATRISRSGARVEEEDPVRAVIGAYAGRSAATGRNADELLYGKPDRE